MKNIPNRINHETLTKEEAKNVLVNISMGSYNSSQIVSFLTVYMMRSVTIDELAGFREALLELCICIDLSAYTIDLWNWWRRKDTFTLNASFFCSSWS
jgi:anthranilate phosphoribosyltransferase